MIHQGEKFKQLLDHSPTSKAELARITNISEGTIYNYFKRNMIPYKNLSDICKAMNWSINEFIEFDQNATDVPIGGDSTEYLMRKDITDKQRVLLLRELVAMKEREIASLQQTIVAQQQTIEALQGRLAAG